MNDFEYYLEQQKLEDISLQRQDDTSVQDKEYTQIQLSNMKFGNSEIQQSYKEDFYDDSSLFSNQIPFKSRIQGENQNFSGKIEYMSQVTVEKTRPYIRRENFLQTYKSLMKYLDKLIISDFTFLISRIEQNQCDGKKQGLSKKIQFISLQLKKVFDRKGLKTENQIYKYLLERSMNTPLLKEHAELIFQNQLKYEPVRKSFNSEFSYKKGKINYFDPDINGSIFLKPIGVDILLLDLKLYCFKDKLYLRVLMQMYKKLLRLLFILEMIFNRIFGKCGKKFEFNVDFTFRYGKLSVQVQKEKLKELQEHSYFTLSENKKVFFQYVEEEGYTLRNYKVEEGLDQESNSLQVRVENQIMIKEESDQDIINEELN